MDSRGQEDRIQLLKLFGTFLDYVVFHFSRFELIPTCEGKRRQDFSLFGLPLLCQNSGSFSLYKFNPFQSFFKITIASPAAFPNNWTVTT